ncbi:hypothetical protein [Uliginosibacterium sp. 31-12]|uniref:hypothetical protein n=1 Tax=Uliginosibacterium sp. 31-12 TaxID=3062781 RepID=UPI0026E2E0EB|nr:hypothetical protein [Uliginosibacterium sp. 31-12]MDO6387013.1 hypothetical protein [Uliginosibacterium sp. 31-12]
MKEKKLTTASLQSEIRNSSKRHFGIHKFRARLPVGNFIASYKILFPHKSSLQDFHGSPFPKVANQLFGSKTPKQRVSALREILWAIARCLQFSKELNSFIETQKKFQTEILNGNYSGAMEQLLKIEEDFGKSFWLYQNQMASAYVSKNESDLSDTATRVIDEVKENGVLHALLYYTRKRIEGATPREKIRSEIAEKTAKSGMRPYFMSKILDANDSSEIAVSNLLFLDSQSSLIDHYTSLILVLQGAVSAEMFETQTMESIRPWVNRLYNSTNDKRLLGVLAALGDYIHKEITVSDRKRSEAIEAYTDENYGLCIDISSKILFENPLDIAVRVLSAKASSSTNRQPEKTGGLAEEINDGLFNLLSANDQFLRSAYALLQTADRFFDHNWAQYLRVAVWNELGAEEKKRSQPWMRDIYVRDEYITPFTAIALDEAYSYSIIGRLDSEGVFPKTLRLVKTIMEHPEAKSDIQSSRFEKYKAREFLTKNKYKEAAAAYINSAKTTHLPIVRLRTMGGASLALMLDGQYKAAVETLIAAYLDCPNAPTTLPFKELTDRLSDPDDWPNTICLGLLFSISNQFNENEDISKLRLSFERFCENNSINSASQLAQKIDEFGAKEVVSYLDNVWLPEVMRQTLLYTTPSEIEESRIEACQVLAKIDSARARSHKEELASRIKQQEISKVSALVEQSKVYVDIDAIKRSLRARLKSTYAQYKTALTQYDRQPSDLLIKLQNAFNELENIASLPTILSNLHLVDGNEFETPSSLQFGAIFQEITKEFLTGDHGLNAYLSTRVRHGKMLDAIRKSVMDEHLVTARKDDGIYVVNTYWSNDLPNPEIESSVIDALATFSFKFDETLFYARDKKIQIKTYLDLKSTDNNNEALFLYHFSNLERQLMQKYDAEFKNIDELIEKCVDSLWEKTDINLEKLRDYVDNTLRNEMLSHFDNLTADLSHIFYGKVPSRLANSIARARTATQQAIDNILNWFRRSEVFDRQDFDVDFPSQIAASMVNRTLSMQSPWHGPKYQISVPADTKLPGRALDSLVDIFYTIFENAAKYAEIESIPLNVQLTLNYRDGHFSCEALSDGKPPSDDQLTLLKDLKSSLDSKESRRLAQSEGRSGFRKILIALSSPMYRNPFLDFDHKLEGLFVVRFGFNLSESL